MAFLWHLRSIKMELAMRTVHPLKPSQSSSEQPTGLFEGELADLYAALLIVVPLAFFLKSFWV